MHSIRVLVVEDSSKKLKAVKSKLETAVAYPLDIASAVDYEAALDKLRTEYFDILVLDILLPSSVDPKPSSRTSEVLLNFVTSGRAASSPLIIGLTQDEKAFGKVSKEYRERLLLLLQYDVEKDDWAHVVAAKLKEIFTSRKQYLNFIKNFPAVDVLLLTARYETEFVPVRAAIQWIGACPDDQDEELGITYCEGLAVVGGRQRKVRLVCMAQMGLSAAAAVTARLIGELAPTYVVMLGMCCGFRNPKAASKAALFDVMISSDAVCWDEGKYLENGAKGLNGFSYRPQSLSLDEDLEIRVRHRIETNSADLKLRLADYVKAAKCQVNLSEIEGEYNEEPKVRLGRNVSGMNIVSSSKLIEEIVSRTPDALSLEMEIFAVFKAASLACGRKPKVFCAKGVADFGEDKEDDRYDVAQPIASGLSYLTFDWFAASLDD